MSDETKTEEGQVKSQLAQVEPQVDQVPAQQQENTFLAVVERAASDPNVDIEKMQQMLDMQERIMNKNAEIAFNQAMARLQPQLPVIEKTSKAHNSKYAKYEHIDAKVRPLYSKEGFSVSFDSKREGDLVTYYGYLNHVDGYSRTAEMVLPADNSGSKNTIQAIGSTMSYAKRYLLCMLLNIVTVDEDDDGLSASSEPIDEEQLKFLQDMLAETETDVRKFCSDFAKVDALANIKKKDYPRLKNALANKKKQLEQKAKAEAPKS